MKFHILGTALGQCLARDGGLTAAYLPDGVPLSTAEAVVRSANSAQPSSPPYAILVSSLGDLHDDPTCPRVTPQGAIRYRQGDRLAVVLGRHPDLASFVQAFRENLGEEYPLNAGGGAAALKNLAQAALDVIFEELGLPWTAQPKDCERLMSCLAVLAEAHEHLGQGSLAWNAYWFRHADFGLTQLAKALQRLAASEPELDASETLTRYTYAAFGLPRPAVGTGYMRRHHGRAVVEALASWWADEQTIETTVKQLGHHPDSPSDCHALAAVQWRGFGRRLAAEDNHLLAWSMQGLGEEHAVDAFAALTEAQFFSPLQGSSGAPLQVEAEDGTPLEIGPTSTGSFAVPAEEVREGMRALTYPIRVQVPTLATVGAQAVQETRIALRTSDKRTAWVGVAELGSGGELLLVGRLERETGRPPFRHLVRPLTLSVDVSSDDSLTDVVDTSSSARVLLLPPGGTGLVVWPIKSKGLGTGKAVGPERYDQSGLPVDQETIYQVDVDSGVHHRVLVWGASGEAPATTGQVQLTSWANRQGLWAGDIAPGGLDSLTVGEVAFEFRTPDPSESFQSPVVAAIHRGAVATGGAPLTAQQSIRGRLEGALGSESASQEWIAAHGHVVLPESQGQRLPQLELEPNSGVLMPAHLLKTWGNIAQFSVPEELQTSEEAAEFRDAYLGLGVEGHLRRVEADGGQTVEWPSRASWRHLWRDRAPLQRYLEAYASLVRRARVIGDASGLFWASYPFSASVWDTSESGRCTAVLLSPLHPVRLAWLAGVEDVLWEAEDARALAGTVEGWNFPLLGPRDSEGGRMIALPIDNGEGQVFLGWSMLVEASVDGHRALKSPRQIAGQRAPGSAASGLNSTAVASALRSYRRMNPHVSTLTVDLAATSTTSRLEEIDDAVLTAVKHWNNGGQAALRGGVRVFDSLHRRGDAPRDALTRLLDTNTRTPVSWSRYQHDTSTPQLCNIRLLQDAGVQVQVTTGEMGNAGLVGEIPLRRFEAQQAMVSAGKNAESRPAMRPDVGWQPFVEALTAIEGAHAQPRISSRLFKALLVDRNADWTVSGETMMNPSAMAALVNEGSGGSQMLWEWRPPFLDGADDMALLERRPFVSVVRVPSGFRRQLREVLSHAQGSRATEEQVDELLGTLGARGVGLSSLVAMGGTHAAGALGFYLSLRLLQQANPDDGAEQLVLPIDACDTFLTALSAQSKHGDSLRRADLLVVRVDDEATTLVPIEIKFYGSLSDHPQAYLPQPGDQALDDALEQLSSTMGLLRNIEARSASLANERTADSALWHNGVAALVEAGLRLSPNDVLNVDHLAQRLHRLVDGRMPIRVGRPVLAYFRHSATTPDAGMFSAHTGAIAAGLGEYGALIANSSAAFEAVRSAGNGLCQAWTNVIAWALSPESGSSSEKESEAPSSAQESRQERSEEPSPDAPEQDSRREVTRRDAASLSEQMPEEAPRANEPKTDVSAEEAEEPRAGIVGDGVRFEVGRLIGSLGDAHASFWPSNTELNQLNVGVVGDLGTGKTQLLKALVYQLRRSAAETQPNPISTLIFDYKRDFQDPAFLERVGGRVLRPQHIPLNVFALKGEYTPLAAYQRAQAFTNILSRIYAGIGPVQRDRIVTIVTSLFKEQAGSPPTLAQLLERYKADIKQPDAVVSILNTFVLAEVFSDDPAALLPFEALMDDCVLVVALNELGTDQEAKNALVALFLNKYYEYMLDLTKWPYQGKSPQLRRLNSFLLVDEATNIMRYQFPVLMDLMLQGREFGVGVILSSQYLSHFKEGDTNYGQPLLTWFIHKVPSVSVKDLTTLGLHGATAEQASAIARLPVHQALYSSLHFPGRFVRGTPFYEL
ncbi:hypothetical protein [Phycicoccus sp. SLBN-51]|uniref:hypothetical protein n=1 Tax=Phycicoccus sp. SLBN-51 TaxID=2768447 RepID=UPI001150AE42|nr:hypothetical protein [Phycicoccus sp. SLBN-51]TQJ50193.1 hypothetical protein FBY26_1893 [Phycicoccus sp. SLBN-51]